MPRSNGKFLVPAFLAIALYLIGGALGAFAPGIFPCGARSAWAAEPAPDAGEPLPENLLPAPEPALSPAVPPASGQQPPSPQQAQHLEPVGFIDLLHGELSHDLLSTAVWMDSFFGNERAIIELNASYLRVRYDFFQEERAKLQVRPAFDMRWVLPQLQRTTHLVFSSEPTEPVKGAPEPLTASGERISHTDQRNVTGALHYFLQSLPNESMIVRAGVQINQFPPVLFIGPRYSSLHAIDSWDFRVTQEATYRTDTQWQTDTLLDLERPFPHDFFFRTSLDGRWYDSLDGYFYSLDFSLREAFSVTHALDYEWVNLYQTRPVNQLTEFAFRVRYRHSFWRDWLYYETAPQIRFPRSQNFRMIPGILFRVEMFFGRAP